MAFLAWKITLGITLTIFGAFLLFFSIFFEGLLEQQIKDGAVLDESTKDLWALFPGKTQIEIFRDSYFYDIDEVDFMNSLKNLEIIPQVKELGPFRAQEKDEWINRKYNSDKSEVEFSLYRYSVNQNSEETKLQKDTMVTTVNVPALGVWTQAKSVTRQSVALTALYTIYSSLYKDFYFSLCSQLVKGAFQDKSSFFGKLGLNLDYLENNSPNIYSDPLYGANSAIGYFAQPFLKQEYYNDDSDYIFFKQYFDLSFFEMEIIRLFVKSTIQKISMLALPKLNGIVTPENVAHRQFLELAAKDTIKNLSNNSTIEYDLEYIAFLKQKGITATELKYEDAVRLFSLDGFPYGKKADLSQSLMLKENMDQIMDETKPREEGIISLINLCKVSQNEANLLYDYLNYLVDKVAFLESKKQYAALSTFTNQAINPIMQSIGSLIFYNIIAKKSYEDYFDKTDCQVALKNLLYNANDSTYANICKISELNTKSLNNIYRYWIPGILLKDNKLQKKLGCTDEEFNYISNTQSDFYKLLWSYSKEIRDTYKLNGGNTAYTINLIPLSVKQFTLGNVLTDEGIGKESVIDLLDFDGNTAYKKPPEYIMFCKSRLCTAELAYSDFLEAFTYDRLFNAYYVQNLFKTYFGKLKTDDKLANVDFINYLQQMIINEVLGGLFIKRPVYDYLWGFESEILSDIKSTNFYLGGDPTVDPIFSFMNNMTSPQPENDEFKWKAYTGKSDIRKTREYKQTNGYSQSPIIVMNQPYFDGQNSKFKTVYVNPWKTKLTLEGSTDAMSFRPLLDKNSKLLAYVDDLFRVASFVYSGDKRFYGFNVIRYTLDKALLKSAKYIPDHTNFYQDKYNGFGNQTSVYGAPLFASQPYFQDCDDLGTAKVDIVRAETKHQKPDDPDEVNLFYDSWFDVEPNSGAVVRAAQKILISAYIENDELFDIKRDIMIPVNYVFRTGNLTKSGLDSFLSDLSLAFNIKFYAILILPLIILYTVIGIFYCSCIRKSTAMISESQEQSFVDKLINKA